MRIRPGASRRATATVELAVLLPFLAFMFVVAIDYCRIFYYSVTIETCARNGAHFAANVFNDPMPYSSIQQAAIADGAVLTPALTTSNVTVSNGTDANSNPTVTVTVSYTFQAITSYPGIPSTVQLVRSVQMRTAPN